MHKLIISNFRSHQHTSLSFSQDSVCLVGCNGAGKTNILEALSLFSPGKGLRGNTANWCFKNSASLEQGSWHLRLELSSPTGPLHIETLENQGKRYFTVNGMRLKHQLDIAQWISMNWVTPATDRMWNQGWSLRRKYFDRIVFTLYPVYGSVLHRYQSSVQERNYALKNYAAPFMFDVLEERMAKYALDIYAFRQQGLDRLRAALSHCDTGFLLPSLGIEGAFESWMHAQSQRSVEDLQEYWHKTREQDFCRKVTSFGPHQSQWIVVHPNGNEIAVSSTGEQKIILLSLILAWSKAVQYLHPKEFHFLLLDEVGAHLDGEHRGALWNALNGLNVFIWMTGVHEDLFTGLVQQEHVKVIREEGVSRVFNKRSV